MTTQCLRCGKCCEKGGPGLHREDRSLVESGRIPASCLFTIRVGELARDNVKGVLEPLHEEMIKIKGISGRWTCIFYDDASKGCGIYENRPLECRVLNCRDTRQIENVYARSRLRRIDLLGKAAGLWEWVFDHEARCGYERIKQLVAQGVEEGNLKKGAEILEIIRYDAHVRQLTVERGMQEKMLDFLFGRPLTATIKMYDLILINKDGRYRLVPQSMGPQPD